jgi:hypothetical protein
LKLDNKTLTLTILIAAIIITGLIIIKIPANDVLAKSAKKTLKNFTKKMFEYSKRTEALKAIYGAGCMVDKFAPDMTPMVWTCPKGAAVNDSLSEFFPDSSVVWR